MLPNVLLAVPNPEHWDTSRTIMLTGTAFDTQCNQS